MHDLKDKFNVLVKKPIFTSFNSPCYEKSRSRSDGYSITQCELAQQCVRSGAQCALCSAECVRIGAQCGRIVVQCVQSEAQCVRRAAECVRNGASTVCT